MNTLFLEIEPISQLKPYIQSYWTGDFNMDESDQFTQLVLPNGCIELIIHLSDDHCFLSPNEGTLENTPESIILGLYERPYTVSFNSHVNVFGIRFYPDGLRTLFGLPPSQISSSFFGMDELFTTRYKDLISRLKEAPDTRSRIDIANDFLLLSLNKSKSDLDYVHKAMEMIRSSQGLLSYHTLKHKIHISERQLQREFKNTYGLSITNYMRLARMNAIHRYMMSRDLSLTELSHELNFTDQAHFTREFKTFVGETPGRFSKNKEQYILNPLVK